ncbi:MAG: LexA family protein [Candidatus Saccharimonadales bacterium]
MRPTKKQYELLKFIEGFIATNGYSPSYREIMTALSYNSVATVALHVNSLIARGHLQKRGASARSLEVIKSAQPELGATKPADDGQKWLEAKIDQIFAEAENSENLDQAALAKPGALLETLKILRLDSAAEAYGARLKRLRGRLE